MTIKQLEYLIELARTKNFTNASDKLYISQSSLSKQIRALESEVGVQLLSRSTRTVDLTSAGEEFVQYAKEIAHTYNLMMNAMQAYGKSSQETLRISIIPVASSYGILENITEFRRFYPEIEIIMEEQDPVIAMKNLLSRKVDACILRNCLLSDDRCRMIPLITDEMVLIASAEHPLANRQSISLSEAADNVFFFMNRQTGLFQYCMNLCEEAGFTPNVSKQFLRLNTIQTLVENNAGVSLIMRQVAEKMHSEKLRIIRLTEPALVDLSIVTRKENYSDAIVLFSNFLQKQYRKQRI